MAAQIIAPDRALPEGANIYRALNPKHLENGSPGDNHFVMRSSHPVGDGVSAGITALISISQLRSLETLRQLCGEGFGVAELNVAEILAPVASSGISVVQQDDASWGAFAMAHAVITGYQTLQGNAGKKRIRQFQRHLVKLARKRFFPPGSDIPITQNDADG